MAVLDPERKAAGRSALRYRPIDTDQTVTGLVPWKSASACQAGCQKGLFNG